MRFLNSIGSLGKYENEADVRRVIVKNVTISNTDNGVRIKTMRGPKAIATQASSIIFQDIIMHNVKNPIIIDQEYNAHGKKQVLMIRSSRSRAGNNNLHYQYLSFCNHMASA